jgi:pSer/pThr/pTyr-binding forkhead associated (FHA) protein
METPAFEEAGPRPIREVALRGDGFDLVARGNGAQDIGRSSEAALRLVHATVSRRHARLIVSDDRMAVYIQDVGGANGTRLNGRTVTGVEAVKEGDVIGLGEVELTVSFVRG